MSLRNLKEGQILSHDLYTLVNSNQFCVEQAPLDT